MRKWSVVSSSIKNAISELLNAPNKSTIILTELWRSSNENMWDLHSPSIAFPTFLLSPSFQIMGLEVNSRQFFRSYICKRAYGPFRTFGDLWCSKERIFFICTVSVRWFWNLKCLNRCANYASCIHAFKDTSFELYKLGLVCVYHWKWHDNWSW